MNCMWFGILLGLSSRVSAQSIAKTCPTSNVCFSLNVPDATAQSGDGDVFFQITAPLTKSWVALGQGTQMAGANIFVVYTSSSGQNVTVSPRLGTGHVEPQHDTSAQITLLEGSGVQNGMMTANVRCSNCKSWNGGSMDFTGSSSSWIYAYKSGSSLDSDNPAESISVHDDAASFTWQLSSAKGGSSANPFVANAGSISQTRSAASPASCTPAPVTQTLAQPSAPGAGCPTAWPAEFSSAWPSAPPTWATSCFPSGHPSWPTEAPWAHDNTRRDDSCASNPASSSASSSSHDGNRVNFSPTSASFGGSLARNGSTVLALHAVLACLAFVALFPIGGVLIRLGNFPGLVRLHAACQMLGFAAFFVAFGLGVWMAAQTDSLTATHAVLGFVLFALVCLQPLSGFVHHALFKKYGARTVWSWIHLGAGRIAILLGIVNGGLGLSLAGADLQSRLAYGLCAGFVGIAYLVAVVIGEARRRRAAPKCEVAQRQRRCHAHRSRDNAITREYYRSKGEY